MNVIDHLDSRFWRAIAFLSSDDSFPFVPISSGHDDDVEGREEKGSEVMERDDRREGGGWS